MSAIHSEQSNTDIAEIGPLKEITQQETGETVAELIITGYFRIIESILNKKLPMDIIVAVMLYY